MARFFKSALRKLVLLALVLLAAFAMAGVPAATAHENESAQVEQEITANSSTTTVSIGADLTAEDGSGDTASWKFSYNESDDPTHLKVEVIVPSDGSSSPVTYSTSLNSNSVDDLIAWLTGIQHEITTQNSR